MWLSDWWATRKRAAALRRLGGPDLDAERRANAMNGEQKVGVLMHLNTIRRRLMAGESASGIAKEFGVTVAAVSQIRVGRTYKEIR